MTETLPGETDPAPPRKEQPAHKENMLANLLLNIIIPTLILIKGSKDEYLGPTLGIIVALAFPICYGLYDYIKTRKINFFSAIGIVSIMLTGGISLLKLPPEYIAIKEAAVPSLLGLAVLGSMFTPFPLIRTFLYNDKILQVDKVHSALETYGNVNAFERVLKLTTYLLASSFFLSAVLNYVLATLMITSTPGTQEYNAELGKFTALSYPVIALPSMLIMFAALFILIRSITKLTHLPWEEILIEHESQKAK